MQRPIHRRKSMIAHDDEIGVRRRSGSCGRMTELPYISIDVLQFCDRCTAIGAGIMLRIVQLFKMHQE